MELNWKEDNNIVRKLAKILLGDTLPNGEPVSSLILLDDTSRAELQRWANMSDAEFAAAQLSGDSIRIDVDDVIRQLEEKYALDPQLLDDLFSGIDADDLDIQLPTREGKPDYDVMATLISAVQKMVIKDVVRLADSRIEKTKELTGNDE